MKILLIFLFSCSLISGSETSAQTFHGIIFANTYDKEIGEAAQNDLKKIKLLYDTICKNLNYNLDTIIKAGSDFTYQNLQTSVNQLLVNEGDIIFFYVVTHGSKNSKDSFPNVFINGRGISMSELQDSLSNRFPEAQTIITISQACNSGSVPNQPIHFMLAPPINMQHNYRPLFVNKQRIIATSSQKGKSSYSTASGSYFTQAFFTTLLNYTGQDFAKDWNELFQKVNRQYNIIQEIHGFKQKNYRRCVFAIQNL
jgi:hypothetical protein